MRNHLQATWGSIAASLINFNQVALYGDRPFFKSCESGAVYTENNTPLRICFLWWDVKQGNWVNWFLSEKPPTTTGPSTAQDWSDLELVCRFSNNFKECFVPFNSTEPTNNGILCLGRVGIVLSTYHLTLQSFCDQQGKSKIPTLPGLHKSHHWLRIRNFSDRHWNFEGEGDFT